jgi:hypothetical protein
VSTFKLLVRLFKSNALKKIALKAKPLPNPTKDVPSGSLHNPSDEESSDLKDRYRYRAGVEATMSEFYQRTGVKHLRVYRMKAVFFSVVKKTTGLNIIRAARFRRKKTHSKHRVSGSKMS